MTGRYPSGGDANFAKAMANQAVSVLRNLGATGFIFINPVYSIATQDLDPSGNTFVLDIIWQR